MVLLQFDLAAAISIHAPHTRSDEDVPEQYRELAFQSTPLIRGATICAITMLFNLRISIHAPHTRSDRAWLASAGQPAAFQSTPLIRGATVSNGVSCALRQNFNPRPSYEERQSGTVYQDFQWYFNPRPSYEERHGRVLPRACRACDFNPRPSYEERPAQAWLDAHGIEFQSTPLIRGATRRCQDHRY